MLRKFFSIAEISTQSTPLYLHRNAGNQLIVFMSNDTSYTFGFGLKDAAVWTSESQAESFLMANEIALASFEGAVYIVQPVYKVTE